MTKKADHPILRLTLANNALIEVPILEEHYRGSNWLAIIDVDPTAPGGLARRFVPNGKGACLYIVEQVAIFDAVEFAADYTTSVGRKHRKRWYGVVVAKTDETLCLVECDTGIAACLRARDSRVDPKQRAIALAEEREALMRRAAKLGEEIEGLVQPELVQPEKDEEPA